jgi:hypothetical protein
MEKQQKINKIYIENLEQDIIARIAELKKISNREAMDIYYKSRLSSQIESGLYGIENMDYKYLADDLIQNETEQK